MGLVEHGPINVDIVKPSLDGYPTCALRPAVLLAAGVKDIARGCLLVGTVQPSPIFRVQVARPMITKRGELPPFEMQAYLRHIPGRLWAGLLSTGGSQATAGACGYTRERCGGGARKLE